MDKAASVAIMPDYEMFCADLREGMIEVFPMLLNNRPLAISAMSEVLSSTELITMYYHNVVLHSNELNTTHYYHILKGSIK